MLLRDLGEEMSAEEVRRVMETFDKDSSNSLNFDEFCGFIKTLVERRRSGELTQVAVEGEMEEEEEEEIPEDLCHLFAGRSSSGESSCDRSR